VTFLSENDPVVQLALSRIIALRRLTRQTGVKTYRSERAILESLDPQVLAAVALQLDEQQKPTMTNEKENFSAGQSDSTK
jgi:hypothetical protein